MFDVKNFEFSKFMVCPHGQGGRVQFFTTLCGRLLCTAPNKSVTSNFHRNKTNA